MKTETQSKTERINLRLEKSAKNLLERAAGFEGKTVSRFILHSALERAKISVQEHEVISFNAENSRIFFDALSAPISFNSKLIDALEEHTDRVTGK